jgi:hypothetical protein
MTNTVTDTGRFNPTVWAMIGIPVAAVLASFLTLFLAIDGAEAELPASFATEGQRLDQDFMLREAARRAGVAVALDATSNGRIDLRLQLELLPEPASGSYAATVDSPLAGRWIARISEPGRWHVIERLELPATAQGDR